MLQRPAAQHASNPPLPSSASRGTGINSELRFQSLRCDSEAFSFPCDEKGRADMDAMDHATLNNYLYARALVGMDFSMARVPRRTTESTHP